jgi:PAS domain S-box-containing protein
MSDYLTGVFSANGLMPHGMCYLWQPGLIGLHVAADALIALAYVSISLTLLYFVRRRADIDFNWIIVCFAVFIVACGATHLMDIWVIWQPVYWLSGGVKTITAVASVGTAILLLKLVPAALRVPGPAEIRKVHEALRAETARGQLASIIESSDDAIIGKSTQGIITSWNSGAERIFGYTANEAIGQPATMLFPPARMVEESQILAQVRRGERVQHFETTRIRKDGTVVDVSVTISPVKDDSGAIVGASKIARDITARKRSEQKLTAQLARLDLLNQITRAIGDRQDLQSIYQVVIRTLEDQLPIDFGCICGYQPAQERLTVACLGPESQTMAQELGLTEQTVISIDSDGLARCINAQLVYEPDTSLVPFTFPRRLSAGGLRSLVAAPLQVESQVFGVLIAARRQADSFSSGECEFIKQVGEHVALAAHQAQLFTALQVAYDELKQSQQAIAQQERLRVMGQMASGIAHDINNALTPASLYSQMLLENHSSLNSTDREYMIIIQRAIDDVAQSVARMKEFYRPRDSGSPRHLIDLNRVIEQVIELTRARWQTIPQERGVAVEMQTELAPDLPQVLGSEAEVRDALLNVILNAVDAMPKGGRIICRSRVLDTHEIRVEVIDTGSGMDEATRARCLEPFFTTKGERGSGLGLSMVYGMVERHAAAIEIESELGRGTQIAITFPGMVGANGQPNRESLGPLRPTRALRLLLVDDDPILLKSLGDVLRHDGHQAITANGGQQGVQTFKLAQQSGEAFDAVITDLGMPQLDGRAVAIAIKSLAPKVPIILLTGWGHRLVAEQDTPPGVDRVLSKPPKLEPLRAALAELVGDKE